MQLEQTKDWQTVAQAAMQVAKSRQAIENLIKKNVIEHKQIGDKKVTHVYIPSLLMHYADKKVDASCISIGSKLDASDFVDAPILLALNIELILCIVKITNPLQWLEFVY